MVIVVLAVLAGLVTVALLFRPFFGDFEGFAECMGYALQPRLFAWLDEDAGEYLWARFKVSLWSGCGFLVGLGVYWGLGKLFG
jgi:hypothetical protein